MGLLDRLKEKLEIVSTPTAPKIGRIPLPEVNSPVPYQLSIDVAASYVDDSASSSSGHTPSPGTPVKRRRAPSFFSRSSTPTLVASPPPQTPSPPQPPDLVAPTPRWRTAPSLMEQGWKNVASPEPRPETTKPRMRTTSMDVPQRLPASRASERLPSSKDKPRAMTPQVGQPRSSTSHRPDRTETPLKPNSVRAPSSPTSARPRRVSASQRASPPSSGEYEAPSVRAASRATDRTAVAAPPAKKPPKGILKPTGPTPVDTSLLAPSELPSKPPTPIPLPRNAFGLHWQLLPANPTLGKYVRFDAGLPVYMMKKYVDGVSAPMLERDFCKPAVEGVKLTRMTIRCAQLPHWPDIVVWSPKGVTCGDVFDGIYDMLHTPLTELEQDKVLGDSRERRRIEHAFRQRCKDAPLLDDYVRQQGLRRVDILQGKRIFAGMQLVHGDRCDLWQMSFESPM